jgi:AcrR family transcriptional regulator
MLVLDVQTMARPKSDDKRNSILAAATRVIATHGLGASTALIAQEAGVASGTLFTYFATKTDLLNQLYLELKTEMASGALAGVSSQADVWAQMETMWVRWMNWAVAGPDKRRALAQLMVSDEITEDAVRKGHEIMRDTARLMDRCRQDGPMKSVPLDLVSGLMSALADTTIDFMLSQPHQADEHCKTAFAALKRMVG